MYSKYQIQFHWTQVLHSSWENGESAKEESRSCENLEGKFCVLYSLTHSACYSDLFGMLIGSLHQIRLFSQVTTCRAIFTVYRIAALHHFSQFPLFLCFIGNVVLDSVFILITGHSS